MRCIEYSCYLILQILNKVVLEHRYPFRTYMGNLNIISIVGKLVNLNSKLLNIEIVKFYKALLKSKDTTYINFVVGKNEFACILKIFEDSYDARNPPMIQSCIRELFEIIFSNNKSNDFHSQKLQDHLINTDSKAKAIIVNPLYRDVFAKYEKLWNKEEDDNFLNQNSDGSFAGSPVSNGLFGDTFGHKTGSLFDKQKIIGGKHNQDWEYEKTKVMSWDRPFTEFNGEDIEEELEDENIATSDKKPQNEGSLSPIGTKNFLRDDEELEQMIVEKDENSLTKIMLEFQNEFDFEKNKEKDFAISLEIESPRSHKSD